MAAAIIPSHPLLDDAFAAHRVQFGSSPLNGKSLSAEEFELELQNPYSLAYKMQVTSVAMFCAWVASQSLLAEMLHQEKLAEKKLAEVEEKKPQPAVGQNSALESWIDASLQRSLEEKARLEKQRFGLEVSLTNLIEKMGENFKDDKKDRLNAIEPLKGKIVLWLEDDANKTDSDTYDRVVKLSTKLNALDDSMVDLTLDPSSLPKNLQMLENHLARQIELISEERAILLELVKLGVLTPEDFQQYQAKRAAQLAVHQQAYTQLLNVALAHAEITRTLSLLSEHLVNRPSYDTQFINMRLSAAVSMIRQWEATRQYNPAAQHPAAQHPAAPYPAAQNPAAHPAEPTDLGLKALTSSLQEKLQSWANKDKIAPPSLLQLQERRDELEELIICPITREPMSDPVRAADGFTYERAAIERWFKTSRGLSPMTGRPLPNQELTSNRAIREKIAEVQNLMAELDVRIEKAEAMEQAQAAVLEPTPPAPSEPAEGQKADSDAPSPKGPSGGPGF
ncbi:hypothetical protein BH10PSE19_BH10PSE19_11780 [soil metagenome]